MDHSADADGMLAALYRASVMGGHIVDAAEVYAWGLTREFAAVRAACRARVAAGAAEHADRRTPPSRHAHLRKVAGDDR